MSHSMHKNLALLLCLLFCLTLVPPAWAREVMEEERTAIGSESEYKSDSVEIENPDGYAILRAAIQSGDKNVSLDGMGIVTIRNDITIPADMFVSAWDGTVIEVPEGVTLNVNGELHADGFILNGTLNVGESTFVNMGGLRELYNGHPMGTLIVGYGSSVDMNGECFNGTVTEALDGKQLPNWIINNVVENGRVLVNYDAWDDDSARLAYGKATSLAESFIGRVNVHFDATINMNTDAYRDHTELFVSGGWGSEGALTIEQGTTVSAAYMCVQNATLTVNGRLINNDRIDLRAEQDGDNGTVSKLPKLIVNGELIGPGMLYVHGVEDEQTARGCIQGLGELNGHWDGDSWVFYSKDSLFDALEAACNERITDYLNLRYLDDITIERSITIPDYLFVDAKGTILTIPNGVTLTVQGHVKTRAFNIQNGGTVVMDGGRLELRETQIGDFKINGALVLNNTTVEIPAPIWGGLSDTERAHITFNGDNAVVRAMFEPTADNIAATFNGANLTVDEHVMPVIDVNIPIELPDNITVNQGVRLKAHKDITVPTGITLTLNASSVSILDDSKLIVYGTLDSKSFLDFAHTENSANNPRLIIEDGGTFTGGCVLGVQDHNNPDAYFSGVDLSAYGRVMDENGTRYMPSEIFYNDLKRACESENPPQNMKFINLGTITIKENLTIPAGVRVNAEGTRILVPDGVTLTVKGILIAGTLELNGSVVFDNENYEIGAEPSVICSPIIRGSEASLTVNHPSELAVMFPATDMQSLQTAAQNAAAQTISNAENKVQIVAEITVPAKTDIPLNGTDMIIERGGKLNLNGTITAKNARVIVKGRLENYGNIGMRFNTGFYMPLLFINGGEYYGGGKVTFYDSAKHIEGMNLDAFSVVTLKSPNRWVYSLNTDFAFEAIQDMAATAAEDWEQSENPEYYELNLSDLGDIRINESVVIPPNMYVNAKNDRIIVPQGVTLTIDGTLRTKQLKIEENGTVTVNGHLRVNEKIFPDGALNLNRTWVNLNAAGWNSLNWENIHLIGNAGFNVIYDADNDYQFISAMNDIQGHQRTQSIRPLVAVHFDMTVGDDHEIPEGVQVDITDQKTFTIPADTTLTVNGTVHAGQDAKIVTNGTLVNNGTVETEQRLNAADSDPRLIFAQGSSYEGRGYLGVMDTNNPKSYISGLDVTGFQTLVDNIGTRYYQAGDVWAELQEAIDNGENYYYMGNLGNITMPYNISLPANFSIETWGTTIIVPRNKTLTIEPGAHIGIHNLNVQTRGKVVVSDNGYLYVYTSLTLSGSMTAGNNARLHLVAQTDNTSFISKITLNNVRGATIHFYPSDETELRSMMTAGDALPDPYYGNIHVRFPWTLSSAIAFDGNTDLEIETSGGYTGSLTIANGGELTLNRYTQVRSSDLTIKAGGKLINNAEIAIHKNDRFPTGTLSREEGGSYEGDGVIRVYGTSEEEAPAHIIGINGLVGLRTERDGEEITEFRPDAFWGLKQAVENGEPYYEMNGVGYVRIAEDLTIPKGMQVYALGWTTVDVPEGITLTINGELYTDGLILNGRVVMGEETYSDFGNLYDVENHNGRPSGEFSVGRDTFVRVKQNDNNVGINSFLVDRWVHSDENASFCIDYYDTWEDNDLSYALYNARNLPAPVFGIVHVLNDKTFRDLDLLNPRDVALELSGNWEGGTWHRNGVTLEGDTRTQYIDVRGSDLYIRDSFEINDRIELHKEQGADPHLTFVDNPGIIGELRIYVYDAGSEEAARGCISGLDGLTSYQEGDAWVFTTASGAFEALKAACADGSDHIDLRNQGQLVIKENITIPAGLAVEADNIIVPEGITLTVNGYMKAGGLVIRQTGKVIDNSYIGIFDGNPEMLVIDGSLEVRNVWFEMQAYFWDNGLDDAEKANISYQGNAGINVVFFRGGAGVEDAIAQAAQLTTERSHGIVNVNFDFTLADNLMIPGDVVVVANNRFTVPAGKTLTVDGTLNIRQSGVVDVFGTLENNSFVEYKPESANATGVRLIIENGAVYTGPGFIGVRIPAVPEDCISGLDLKKDFVRRDDDRGSRFRLRPMIDLMLPAMLTEIESEAFAGGVFSSVYIPATVTTIAADAFGSRQGLTVFGTTDTARTFAEAHGYTFIQYDATA